MKKLLHLTSTIALALTLLLTSARAVNAKTSAFSSIVAFGDSLSDTGNFHALTGFPPPPYFDGRFCNGPVWVEYLAQTLRAPLLDFAYGGATTGHRNSNGPGLPGLLDEVESFVSANCVQGLDPAALYVVWAGANDFFVTLEAGGDPDELVSAGVANTIQAVHKLAAAGGKYFLVPNVADLGATPYVAGSGLGAQVSALAAIYNQVLNGALAALSNNGLTIITLDAYAVLDAMAYSPEVYGFSNTTTPFLFAGGDPSKFLFWDPVHPTTRAHEVLGDAAVQALLRYFSPAKGVANPPARVNALNGLVRER